MMISLRLVVLTATSLALAQVTTAFVVTTPSLATARGGDAISSSSSSSSSPSSSSTSLGATSKYKKIFVAGGSRGVGRQVVEQLVAKQDGTKVVCMVRDAAVAQELNSMNGVTAIIGDAVDQKTVENAMDGCDAAITTLGGKVNPDESLNDRIDYIGNNNVIESAGILGVTRVILVTSVGCGSSQPACPPKVYETLKDRLEAKSKAENVLQRYYTNTNWTIIRPGGLKSEPATGRAILTQDASAIGTIHRADLARLILQALESDTATERKILTAIDPSIESATAEPGHKFEAFAM
jgi:nucleoside-diphosphate-sugar epimerase